MGEKGKGGQREREKRTISESLGDPVKSNTVTAYLRAGTRFKGLICHFSMSKEDYRHNTGKRLVHWCGRIYRGTLQKPPFILVLCFSL